VSDDEQRSGAPGGQQDAAREETKTGAAPDEAQASVPGAAPTAAQAPAAGEEAQAVQAAAPARDAFIFVPGLSSRLQRIDVVEVGKRLALALDHNAASEKAHFAVEPPQEVAVYDAFATRKVAITRTDPGGGAARPVVDVFELDYRPLLRSRYGERSPLRQAFGILVLMGSLSLRFVAFAAKPGKSFGEKAQLAAGAATMLVVALYLVILIATALGIGGSWMGVLEQDPAGATAVTAAALPEGASDWLKLKAWLAQRWYAARAYDYAWLQQAIVLFTALGLLNQRNVKEAICDAGVQYAGVIDYLGYDRQKDLIVGQFTRLLESLLESGNDYARVHVLGYSFGSIVAIDCVFQRQPPPRHYRRLRSLVTVGSPYDLVRSFWPGYFEGRRGADEGIERWLNVFSPDDVLSSNFRDDAGEANRAEFGVVTAAGEVKPENIVFDWVARKRKYMPERLVRFTQLHLAYWGADANARTFMDEVVRGVYGGDEMLG